MFVFVVLEFVVKGVDVVVLFVYGVVNLFDIIIG